MRFFITLSAMLVTGAILTGCVRSPYVRDDAFAVMSELFSPDDFKHTLVRDGTGRMEVLHAATLNREVSVLFVETYETGVLSDIALFPRSVMKGWKVLQGESIEFGLKGNAETPGGNVSFERFSYEANQCFAFHSIFEPYNFDTLSRFSRLIAGYYCQTLAAPLPDAAVAKFLGSITVPKYDYVELIGEISDIVYYQSVAPLKTRSIPPGRN